MKRFICIIFLIVISQVIGSQKNHKAALIFTARSLNSQLKNFLENDLRNIMRNSQPILDPYKSDGQIMEFDDGTLMINGKLSKFTVDNLSNYIVRSSNVNIWNRKVNIELHFPTITSSGFYNVDARYKNIPYIGNGYYNVTVRDFSISAELYIKIIGGVQIKSLVLKISIGGFDFVASSDNFDDEEESNEWSANISQLVPIVISDHHDPIVAFVTPKIIAAINQQLQNNLLKNNNDNADISISNISGYNNSAFILCINYYVNTHTKKHCKGNLE